jgi:large subunit ribosomal protein L18
MSRKIDNRQRRIRRSRCNIQEQGVVYLSVDRTIKHISVQIFTPGGKETLASASSREKEIQAQVDKSKGKKGASEAVGKFIAERAKLKGITKVAFDRSGNKYHGRIRAVAEAARANGLMC